MDKKQKKKESNPQSEARKLEWMKRFRALFPGAKEGELDPSQLSEEMMAEAPDMVKPQGLPEPTFEFPPEVLARFAQLDQMEKEMGESDLIYMPEVPPQDGEFIIAQKDGTPVQIQNYKEGQLHGLTKIYQGKVLMEKTQYQNGKMNGEKRIYNEAGKLLMIEMYKNDKRHGITQQITDNGVVIMRAQYRNGTQEGLTIHYTEAGELHAKIHYKENKKNGLSLFFYPEKAPDQDPKVAKTVTYKDDQQHGEAITYYPSGAMMMKENYVNNRLEGGVVEYYENGNVRKITQYEKGKPVGAPVMYDVFGKKLPDPTKTVTPA